MNTTTDFDRLVTKWLEGAGPASMRPESLDAAIEAVRATTPQQGLRAFLVRPAPWPAGGRRGLATLPPTVRLAIVLGLLATIVTAGILVGSQLLRKTVDTPIDAIQVYEGRLARVSNDVADVTSPIALPDDRMLAFDDNGAVLWNSETGGLSRAGSLTDRRFSPIPIVLTDGRVLVIGGNLTEPDAAGARSAFAPTTAELWDPATRASSPSIPLAESTWIFAAIRLPDGRVLVTGGMATDGSERTLATAQLFAPATGTFTRTGSMSAPRAWHSMSLLPDGRVAVVGGGTGLSDDPDTSTTEIYDPATGSFSPGDPLDEIVPSADDSRYPLSTRTPVVTLTGGEVLVPGLRCQEVHALRADGLSDGARPTPIERFDPDTQRFDVIGTMPHCVQTAIPLPNGELYVLGWWYDASTSHQWAGLYNPRTGDVDEVETPTVNAQPYIHIAALPDGRVLFFGTGIEVME